MTAQVAEAQRLQKEAEGKIASVAPHDSNNENILAIVKPKGEAGNKKSGFNLREAMKLDGAVQKDQYDAIQVRFPPLQQLPKCQFFQCPVLYSYKCYQSGSRLLDRLSETGPRKAGQCIQNGEHGPPLYKCPIDQRHYLCMFRRAGITPT